MENNTITRIIRKYLSARFAPETEEKVQKWIIKEKDLEEKEKAAYCYWQELPATADSDTYSALNRVNRRIGHKKTIPLHRRMARIAAVLIPLFIIAGGYVYYQSADNEWIETSVAYGEKKHFLLPDGSEIWLNAGSTVEYPKTFTDKRRLVRLDGEAYFSVKKDASKPFVVETSQISVKVLGTKFNVKAYADDATVTTTLTSGKVEVTPPSHSSQILKPNEQLTYDKNTSDIVITEIPAADTDSWISGKLIFHNASFAEIRQTLERRYNVSINTDGLSIPASKRYNIRFLKNENLEEVLTVLKEMIGFDYQKQGDRIEVIKKQ